MSAVITHVQSTATVAVPLITNYNYSRISQNIIHDTMESGTPQVTLRPAQTRSGRLEVLCSSRAMANDVEAIATTVGTIQLTSASDPLADMTFVVSGAVQLIEDSLNRVWNIFIDYREV